MDKQKQIEEMASDICNMCRDMYGVCDNKEELCPAIKAEMEYLYNAGYRKIPEGSVVLMEEELDKKIEPFRLEIIALCKDLVQTRKETAEKIYKGLCENWGKMKNCILVCNESEDLKDLIDEICKEITEGKNG